MDPVTISALGTIISLIVQYGPWAVAVIVIFYLGRIWKSGEFLPKGIHDQIIEATKQRYVDLLDRFNNQQEAIKLWREHAERAAKAAEQSQARQTEVMARISEMHTDLRELRDDIRDFRDGIRPPTGDNRSRPPQRPWREGA